jgi:hypothetical protein
MAPQSSVLPESVRVQVPIRVPLSYTLAVSTTWLSPAQATSNRMDVPLHGSPTVSSHLHDWAPDTAIVSRQLAFQE